MHKQVEELHIIVPSISDDAVSEGLYKLSEALGKLRPDNQHHGCLGGEWGYGQDFENDVFQMFPFYWGECTCGYDRKAEYFYSHTHHSEQCYQKELAKIEKKVSWFRNEKKHDKLVKKLCKKFGIAWNSGKGSAVHCTCNYEKKASKWENENFHKKGCPTIRPNFVYKPTGFEVRWYKYIGRSQEFNKISKKEWAKIMKECLNSLKGEKCSRKK